MQWIDGSFCEQLQQGREPADIDVVTFVEMPDDPAASQQIVSGMQTAGLFLPNAKTQYRCDGYFITFPTTPPVLISLVAYWFGLFSHRRETLEWKGILQIGLDPSSDPAAMAALEQLKVQADGA